MTYWLCITNEEYWAVVKQKNIWSVVNTVEERGGGISKTNIAITVPHQLRILIAAVNRSNRGLKNVCAKI
jgi:hypothetical protein